MFFSLNIYPSASPSIYHHLMTSQIHYSLEMLSDIQQGFYRGKVAWGMDSLPHHGLLSCYVSKEACQWDLALIHSTVVAIVILLKPRPFYSLKACSSTATVSGLIHYFILQLGQDSRIWTEVQYILPNKHDYQKQGLKKEEERKESSKRSQEHFSLIPRNMLLKVEIPRTFYLFIC